VIGDLWVLISDLNEESELINHRSQISSPLFS
jgi:hypothetical protein